MNLCERCIAVQPHCCSTTPPLFEEEDGCEDDLRSLYRLLVEFRVFSQGSPPYVVHTLLVVKTPCPKGLEVFEALPPF